jgi:AraC-like DNA-binding protein/ligand-binding sensor protein
VVLAEAVRNDTGAQWDLEKAKTCLDNYCRSTTTNGRIIDRKGESLYVYPSSTEICRVCCSMRGNPERTQECTLSHLYGSYQAERFGGRYIYFCPLGFVHWSSPLTYDGRIIAAFVGGPVLMVEPDDFIMIDAGKREHMTEEQTQELMNLVNRMVVIRADVVNSHSEMLFIVAAYASGFGSEYFLLEKDNLDQQSNISEYIHYIKTMGGSESDMKEYPLEKEKELMSLISIGDKQGSQKLLNEIFGHIFFSTGGNFEVIKARVLELVVLLSRAAMGGGADIEQIFGLNYKYLAEIHSFYAIEELAQWLSMIMARFTDCVFNLANVKHIDVIYRAIDYIKRNYMKKITLEEVSTHVYLSPSYFSKIFKDEMHCNFNTYLNNTRIEMSKRLLLDDSIPLVDISNLAGYEDQSYYTKVFKKMTGISPGKYRESRGKAVSMVKHV